MAQIKFMLSVNRPQKEQIQAVANIASGGNMNAYIRSLIAADMAARGEDWPKDHPIGRMEGEKHLIETRV